MILLKDSPFPFQNTSFNILQQSNPKSEETTYLVYPLPLLEDDAGDAGDEGFGLIGGEGSILHEDGKLEMGAIGKKEDADVVERQKASVDDGACAGLVYHTDAVADACGDALLSGLTKGHIVPNHAQEGFVVMVVEVLQQLDSGLRGGGVVVAALGICAHGLLIGLDMAVGNAHGMDDGIGGCYAENAMEKDVAGVVVAHDERPVHQLAEGEGASFGLLIAQGTPRAGREVVGGDMEGVGEGASSPREVLADGECLGKLDNTEQGEGGVACQGEGVTVGVAHGYAYGSIYAVAESGEGLTDFVNRCCLWGCSATAEHDTDGKQEHSACGTSMHFQESISHRFVSVFHIR